jgi:hypothetical protein
MKSFLDLIFFVQSAIMHKDAHMFFHDFGLWKFLFTQNTSGTERLHNPGSACSSMSACAFKEN